MVDTAATSENVYLDIFLIHAVAAPYQMRRIDRGTELVSIVFNQFIDL